MYNDSGFYHSFCSRAIWGSICWIWSVILFIRGQQQKLTLLAIWKTNCLSELSYGENRQIRTEISGESQNDIVNQLVDRKGSILNQHILYQSWYNMCWFRMLCFPKFLLKSCILLLLFLLMKIVFSICNKIVCHWNIHLCSSLKFKSSIQNK